MHIAVYGLGNVLMGDDALGPYVVEALLAGYEIPPGVVVADLGTPGLDLAPYVAGLDALVLVDTVRATGEPGHVRTYRLADILRHPPGPRIGPHDPGVKESLLLAAATGEGPSEVLLVGVIPESTATGVGLSPRVKRAVPSALASVVAELGRLGVPIRPREQAGEPAIWWEQAAVSSPPI